MDIAVVGWPMFGMLSAIDASGMPLMLFAGGGDEPLMERAGHARRQETSHME